MLLGIRERLELSSYLWFSGVIVKPAVMRAGEASGCAKLIMILKSFADTELNPLKVSFHP